MSDTLYMSNISRCTTYIILVSNNNLQNQYYSIVFYIEDKFKVDQFIRERHGFKYRVVSSQTLCFYSKKYLNTGIKFLFIAFT